MFKTATVLSFLFLFSGLLKAQEWQQISPEIARTHLLKKADPVYPAFAEAAGVEGEVRINVGIYTDGRIHSVEIESGPPALFEAAKRTVLKYVYLPFEKDGRPVNVETTVEVSFKLPEPHDVERSYPPPSVAELNFSFLRFAIAAKDLPASFQEWLNVDLRKKRVFFSCDASASASDTKIILVPIRDPAARLYLVFHHETCMCGASGNCPLELVEVDDTGVHGVIDSIGGEVALRQRKDALDPDIFSISHMSAEYANIAGFIKIDGVWGQLYCGRDFSYRTQESEIHVCR
jgi:TonB family protein